MSNQTLQELLNERVAIFASSDRPREMIDAGIEKLFKDVTEEAFRSYGDMGKAVKDAVKAAMPANISDMFELTRYNALIANSMREQWLSSGVEGDMLRRANEAMTEALKDEVIPSKVSLRELIDLFVQHHKEEAIESQWEHPEVRFIDSDCGGMRIHFDKEPESSRSTSRFSSRLERSEFELENMIGLNWDRRDPAKDEHGNHIGRVYSAKINGNPIGKDFSIHSRWERLLAALYFGAATLIVDCSEDDFSYDLYD